MGKTDLEEDFTDLTKRHSDYDLAHCASYDLSCSENHNSIIKVIIKTVFDKLSFRMIVEDVYSISQTKRNWEKTKIIDFLNTTKLGKQKKKYIISHKKQVKKCVLQHTSVSLFVWWTEV